MKIIINEKCLTGNCGNATTSEIDAYVEELRDEFESICQTYFPNAETEIEIDVVSASGCSRETDIDFEYKSETEENNQDFERNRSFERAVQYAPNEIWEKGNFWEI